MGRPVDCRVSVWLSRVQGVYVAKSLLLPCVCVCVRVAFCRCACVYVSLCVGVPGGAGACVDRRLDCLPPGLFWKICFRWEAQL